MKIEKIIFYQKKYGKLTIKIAHILFNEFGHVVEIKWH